MIPKDHIEKEKKITYLKLAKQGEEKKMECKHSWDNHKNSSNGILELRGKRGYSQIFSWKSLTMALKDNKGEEEEAFLSWFLTKRVAGNDF